MNKLSDNLYPGRKFLKSAYGPGQQWASRNANPSFILLRAIVIDIYNENENESSSIIIPPGSINGKIIGEDVSSLDPRKDINSWFPPLFSLHNIVIPEKGEEVWIIRETSSLNSQGMWVGRVNDTSLINKSLAREWMKDATPREKYGFNFDVKDISPDITQTKKKVLSIPLIPGDVIQQGRSGSFVRHSLDPRTQKGVLEFGIKNDIKYAKIIDASIGPTKTKTLHTVRKDDISIIQNEADQIINASNLSDESLNRSVLGDKQNVFFATLLDKIGALTESISGAIVAASEATKASTELIVTKGDVSIVNGSGSAATTSTHTVVKDVKLNSETKATDINFDEVIKIMKEIADLRKVLKNHLSKYQFIN